MIALFSCNTENIFFKALKAMLSCISFNQKRNKQVTDFYQRFLNLFRSPTALELAATELEEARRDLLRTQSAHEYAGRIAEYHQDRIKRLSTYIKDQA